MLEVDSESEGKWAPAPGLIGGVNLLFEAALQFNHQRINDLSGSTLKSKLQDLREQLQIDEGEFSRWRLGKAKRSTTPITRRLCALLTGEIYIERKGDPERQRDDRQFAKDLLDFWKQNPANGLDEVLKLLQAHETKLARIVELDRLAEYERTRASLAAAAAAVGRRSTSLNFVIDPTPEALPPELRPRRAIIHREAAVANLEALFANWHNDGCLVALSGPPRSGKSAVFQQFAGALCRRQDPPIGILYVDFSDSQRPLRSLYLALRGSAGLRSAAVSSADLAEGEEDPDETLIDEAEFVFSYIPSRLVGHKLVTFLESYPEISGNEAHVREMQRIVGSPTFRRAFNLLETHGEVLATSALLTTTIPLEPFSASQAKEFLVEEGQPNDRAKGAVDLLSNDHQLLYPGILLQGAFRFDPRLVAISGENPTAEDLALIIMEHAYDIAQTIVEKLCSSGGYDHQGAMVSLMSMAVFQKAPIPPELLSAAELAPIPNEQLLRVGWLERPGGARLIGFGHHAIRAAAALALSGRGVAGGADELRAAIQRLSTILFKDHGAHAAPVLDESVAWLKRQSPRETKLLAHLQALLMQESVFDPVSPLTDEEGSLAAADFLRQGADNSDLDAAVAALALYAREPFDETSPRGDLVGANFLTSLRSVTALIRNGLRLDSRQLFALDAAIYIGSRRFHLFDESLAARKATYATLVEQEKIELAERNGPWLSAWLSFLMNVADLSLGLGDGAEGHAFAERAKSIAEETSWLHNDSWKHWLLARLAMLGAQLATDASEQKAELTEAVQHAAQCLALAFDDPRCIRFYLRTLRRLVDIEGDEHARQQHVDAAKEHLEIVLGPCDGWDVSVRAQFASVMRREARCTWNVVYQRTRAREALSLLWTTRPGGRQEIDSDPQASLVQARLQAFLGEEQAALVSCDKSLKLAPSPAAWHLKLRLLDSGGGQQDWSEGAELSRSDFAPLEPNLKAAIKTFRTWTRADNVRNRSYGAVVLWIVQREWQAQGSLERHLARELSRQQIDYNGLTKDEKLKRLSGAFRRREQQLTNLRKRFDESIGLVLGEFRNAAQFVRSKSVLTGDPPDANEALIVIDKGLERFSGSHALLFWRAEYLRYIWDTDSAVEGFRKVRAIATNGDLRRRGSLCLVRCLHTLVVHREDADSQQRAEWLDEAKGLLDELSGSFDDAEEVAILKDYVALESGSQVDWSSLDNMYGKIVGVIDGFPSTLISNYDRMQPETMSEPTDIAQALQSNFADPECLGFAGLLYLRRAEKEIGNRSQEDFACAIAFLRAQAVIERSWSGHEYPATSFRIGRTIMSAAESFRSLNPIEGLDTEGRTSQMALAEAKFNSAGSRGAGEFRTMARLRQGLVSRLAAELRR